MKRDKFSRIAGKSEKRLMTTASDTVDEASFKLRAIACPTWSDTRSSSIARAARPLGLSFTQARRIIYREVKCVPAHVLDNIRAAYARLEARAEQAADLQLERARLAQEAFHAADTQLPDEHHGADRKSVLPRG